MVHNILIAIVVLLFVCFWLTSKPRGYPPVKGDRLKREKTRDGTNTVLTGPFRLPLLGYVFWIDSRLPYRTWNKLRRYYGDVLGLYLGTTRLVLVNGWDAVKEGLQNDQLNDRPDPVIFRDTKPRGDMTGVMFTNHEIWKAQRRFTLFHLKNLGFGKKSHESIIHDELHDLIHEFKAYKSQPFSVQTSLGVSAINILWAIIGGERFSKKDEQLRYLVDLIFKAFRAGKAAGGIVDAFPSLRYIIPNLSGYSTLKEAFMEVNTFLQTQITEHKKSLDTKNPRDFIDMYLIELQKEGGDESFDEIQLAGVCFDLFNAGTETGSSFLAFAILFLCLYPEELRKLQKEIDEVVGPHHRPSIEDRDKLVRMDAFVHEVMRYRTPAPHTVPHYARVDTMLQGYRIPKDTLVQFNLRSVLMDEEYWEDPEEFRPSRFIENGSLKKYERMIPFGRGRRACLGEPLARMTSFLTLTALVQNFDFCFPSGEVVEDTEGFTGFSLGPPQFRVIAEPRQGNNHL